MAVRCRGLLFFLCVGQNVLDSLRWSVLTGRDRMGVALVRESWRCLWPGLAQLVREWFGVFKC